MNANKILEDIKSKVEKRYGSRSITTFGAEPEKVEFIKSPSISLNEAIGVGGFPKSRIVEIFGQEGCGKTTLAAHVVAQAQRDGGICAYIDVENAVDEKYFNDIGVITNPEKGNFLISQPSSGEEALGIIEILLDSPEISVIVLDSVAVLSPQAELDGEIEDSTIGLMARLMGKAIRRLTAKIGKSNTCVIFINQLRANIGVMGYGPKYITTGGKALPFAASVRLELSKIAQIKDGEDVIGSRTKVKVVKNKVGSPFRDAEYDLIFGEGISQERELLELGVKKGIINKGGAWFNYGEHKWQGLEKARLFLKENPKIKEELYEKLK